MNKKPSRKSQNKYKAMFFTWNAPDDDNTFEWCLQASDQMKSALQKYKYLSAYQWESEIGEEDHRNHLQGVIFFTTRILFTQLQNYLAGLIP